MRRLTASTFALFVGLLAAYAPVLPFAQGPAPATVEPAAPYVPTPASIVDELLALAGVGPNDVVVDLGSGDGRLVISAVTKYQA
ncbi:MAG: SAM-dependent methyltransferase, partial [Betaproteobacteria bacterium]|nr:SAM-dependent methyltransferase [Betaproteobacteria bacterium]